MSTPEQEPALATLARFYEAESAYLTAEDGNFSGIAATLDPDCVIYQPASLPYGGEWRGHSGFEAWMQAFSQQWSSLEIKDAELYPQGDVIVSKSHVCAVAKATGQHLDWPLLQFFKVRENKILELRPFYWDTAALLVRVAMIHQCQTSEASASKFKGLLEEFIVTPPNVSKPLSSVYLSSLGNRQAMPNRTEQNNQAETWKKSLGLICIGDTHGHHRKLKIHLATSSSTRGISW